jgi:hypothetical protein
MKTFMCVENGERFTIQAEDLQDAMEQCCVWNAEVLYEF